MSENTPRRRQGRAGSDRPSPASRGVVRVDEGFTDEFPDGDPAATEAHASLVRLGDVLLRELDRRIQLTFGVPQPVATALAVIEGADRPLTPSEISERVIVPSATMTATLDVLERRGWIERRPNPDDRRSTLVSVTEAGRATADQLLAGVRVVELETLGVLSDRELHQLLRMLEKVMSRAAEVAERDPIPLEGRRNRPQRG
ncbi:MAG TPA: MarR family transcriptional regulator [Candidatus Nanopelagicales bacterium]|nr:MarR family transcriptional regulator [Candidatus Nanopelagicales bacterium]